MNATRSCGTQIILANATPPWFGLHFATEKKVLWQFLPQKCHKFLNSLTRTEKLEKFVACHIEKSNVTSNVTFCDIVTFHKKPFSTKTFQHKKTFTNKNHPN